MSCVVAANCLTCRVTIGVDCLFYAHDYHISMCEDLKEFCGDPDQWGDRDRAKRLNEFLVKSVRQHMADEEEVLIPFLRQLDVIDDDKGECSLIEAEHRRDSHTLHRVACELHRLGDGLDSANPAALVVSGASFTVNYLHHIEGEEVGLRPLARVLTQGQHRDLWAEIREKRARSPRG